jgi:hypothetical protein
MTRLSLWIAIRLDALGFIRQREMEHQRTVARYNAALAQLRRYEAGERV